MDAHCRADALPHAPFADTRRAYSDRSPPPRHRPYGLEHSFDRASQNVHCACTHYLVFKEPAVPDARSARPAALPLTTTGRLQANLPRLPEGSHSVNPLSRAFAALSNREERIGGTSVLGTKKSALGFLQEQIVRCLPARVVSCVLPDRQPRTSGARSNRNGVYATPEIGVKLYSLSPPCSIDWAVTRGDAAMSGDRIASGLGRIARLDGETCA